MIVGVLLAAGGATRFGSQKLIAWFRGGPLVAHAAHMLAGVTSQTIAVVGNDADAVRTALAGTGVEVIENPDWEEGLSSSLRRGVGAVPKGADAVIVALGDQPSVDASIVRALEARWHDTGRPIVATRYRGLVAPPVLLARSVFREVAALRGDVGARPLISRDPERVSYVDLDVDLPPDVDTVGDLSALDD